MAPAVVTAINNAMLVIIFFIYEVLSHQQSSFCRIFIWSGRDAASNYRFGAKGSKVSPEPKFLFFCDVFLMRQKVNHAIKLA
jgi:hypothetical protein